MGRALADNHANMAEALSDALPDLANFACGFSAFAMTNKASCSTSDATSVFVKTIKSAALICDEASGWRASVERPAVALNVVTTPAIW